MIKNIKWLALASLAVIACNNDDDAATEVAASSGSADFSKYVALGDSFAAGFSDGALFKTAQKTSYPAILAGQLATAGGGSFTIPYMNDDIGGFTMAVLGGPRMYLYKNPTTGDRVPTVVTGTPTTDVATHLTGPFSNLGVPGAKSFHLIAPGYGSIAGIGSTANPYFVRFASSATTTVVADALAQNPTFFSLWIGGNDSLGYATTGGDGSNPLTPTATFDFAYNDIVNQMTANGRKGVVANLPYVSTLPYFTTVPFNPLTSKVLGNGNTAVGDATINALNTQLYGPLKGALTALGQGNRINLLSTTAANPLLIKDEALANLAPQLSTIFQGAPFNMSAQQAGLFAAAFGQARQATASDLVLLTTQAAIGAAPTATDSGLGFAPPAPLNKFGITFPLQDKHLLVPTELTEIQTATDAYNATIQSVATAKGLAFVDAKAIMNQLVSANGIVANGYTLKEDFVTGGAFSLDGVHPSPRGYALIANKFIEAINAKYGSTVSGVNVGTYRVLFPSAL